MERGFERLVGRSRRGGCWSRRRCGSCICIAVFPASEAAVAVVCAFPVATGCRPVPVSGEARSASGAEPRAAGAVHRAWRVGRRECPHAVGDDTSLGPASRRCRGCSNFAGFRAVKGAEWNFPSPGSRRSLQWQVQMPGGMWPGGMQGREESAFPETARPGNRLLSRAALLIG